MEVSRSYSVIDHQVINLQFMFCRVTGRTVGKDRIGIARMYQAIETLTRFSSYTNEITRRTTHTLQKKPNFPL